MALRSFLKAKLKSHSSSTKMTKVFVLGASGFIGNPVAKAFARTGHEVYGLTRSPKKAADLLKDEIYGVVGEVDKPETWAEVAGKASIIIGAVDNRPDFSDALIENVAKVARESGRKIIFIFTSGVWIYGNRPNEICEETDIYELPSSFTWLAKLERAVLQNTDIRGIVLRPGMVYGRAGSLFSSVFSQATQGKVTVFGNEDSRWSMVHTDDLAEMYVSAAEKISLTQGEIINITNTNTESATEIARAALRAVGQPQGVITYSAPSNTLEEALTFYIQPSNRKAISLLGFQQKHLGVVDGINVYVKSWQAHQS